MFFSKAVFCRMFKTVFLIAIPILPYREPMTINSCSEIGAVCKKAKNRLDASCYRQRYRINGLVAPAKESLKNSGIQYTIYDTKSGIVSWFSGLLYCADCGEKLCYSVPKAHSGTQSKNGIARGYTV